MEVIFGFAVGYWVGTRHGREGLARALDSARAIWESPETRRLLSEGLTTVEAAAPALERLQRGRGRAGAVLITSVVDEFRERRSARAA
jgi:hypothetical protein